MADVEVMLGIVYLMMDAQNIAQVKDIMGVKSCRLYARAMRYDKEECER